MKKKKHLLKLRVVGLLKEPSSMFLKVHLQKAVINNHLQSLLRQKVPFRRSSYSEREFLLTFLLLQRSREYAIFPRN